MSAIDAVVAAVEMLEDDPLYNAGYGSKIQSDGKIRMSASLMDGAKRRFSGCVNVENIKNPIRLAEKLLAEENRVLAEKGAELFAKKKLLKFASPYSEERLREYRRQKRGKSGTVGAIALDKKGRLAAATSTGGRGFEFPHRVSDSPTVAGNFSNQYCALSTTGTGEEIVEFAVAAKICSLVEIGVSLDDAAKMLLSQAIKAKAQFGFIALDFSGNYIGVTATRHLTWAAAHSKGFEIHA